MIRTLLHSAPIVMLSHQRPFSCYFTAPTTVPHRDSIQSGQRPERHDRIESGEHRVTPIMRKRIGIEHHARINNDRPRHRHIQCRRSGTIIDLRRTRERNLRVRHALLNRLERTGKIHRQRTLWTQNGSDDYVNASDVLRHVIEDNTIPVRLARSRSCSARSIFRAIMMRSMWCSMAWRLWIEVEFIRSLEARLRRARC